jgi:hypothetical protein
MTASLFFSLQHVGGTVLPEALVLLYQGLFLKSVVTFVTAQQWNCKNNMAFSYN